LRLLLDTRVLLWWQRGDQRLNPRTRDTIASADTVLVSAAALWEIAIKTHLGRLDADLDAVFDLAADGFRELPIRGAHAKVAASLPAHHNDPFDRMMVAQARVEDLILVSADGIFGGYDVRLLK
jgi:PIN domain nuclease of toxin-antitoxin system